MAAVVYMARNLINGKRYIGVTIQKLEKRVQKHAWEAQRGFRYPFKAAIRKYGQEMFRYSVLMEYASWDEAATEEIRLIELLQPEYNATRGGEGSLGHKVSKEARQRMSAARGRRPAPNKGVPHTQATKDKIQEKRLARGTDRRSVAALHRVREAVNVRRRKHVSCLTDGNAFASATAASLHYGYCRFAVSNAISKEGGYLGSRVFAYEVAA